MPRVDNFSDVTPHCVMCGNVIGPDRPKHAITCSKECSDRRKNWRRSKQDARECRYCRRPASLAERTRYLRWRRFEEKNPPPDAELSPEEIAEREYRKANPPKKRGPKPKPNMTTRLSPSDVGLTGAGDYVEEHDVSGDGE
jgi:predicted nucleic acid-binding Zn ribbon protein